MESFGLVNAKIIDKDSIYMEEVIELLIINQLISIYGL
jgi:hypothetical protein